MRTRAALVSLAALGLSLSSPPSGAQRGGVPRIALLTSGPPPATRTQNTEGFRRGLRDPDYVEGETIALEIRSSEGRLERLPDLAAEVVLLKVDIIVAAADPPIKAATWATQTIPIVMSVVGDPVGTGLVASG